MQLALSRVSYTHPAAQDPILNTATIAFAQGWTGLLGDNGCGKSTLARVACGFWRRFPSRDALTASRAPLTESDQGESLVSRNLGRIEKSVAKSRSINVVDRHP